MIAEWMERLACIVEDMGSILLQLGGHRVRPFMHSAILPKVRSAHTWPVTEHHWYVCNGMRQIWSLIWTRDLLIDSLASVAC